MPPSTVIESVEELACRYAQEINAICAEADAASSRSSQIQAIAHKAKHLIKSVGLIVRKVVPPSDIGVDPCNRMGAMLEPVHAHELLDMFVLKGWSDSEVIHACASEVPPGAEGDKCRAKNKRLVEQSQGLLAPSTDRINATTVVNSHTCAALRIVHYSDQPRVKACPVTEKFCGTDGIHISKERVMEMCPSLKRPCEEGIEMDIIPHQLTKLCPTLMGIISEADNAKHDTYRQETPLQIMLNLHARIVQALEDTPSGQACVYK